MIEVSRLNGSTFFINPVYIESFEATPDVIITLTNGRKLVVRETIEQMLHKMQEFYTSVGGLKVVLQHQSQPQENEE